MEKEALQWRDKNELSTTSKKSLTPAEDTQLDMLMMRTAVYYPHQELSKLTIAEFRAAYGQLAIRHGVEAVEQALCELKLKSKFFPHPAEITEEIAAHAADRERAHDKGRWERQEAHMREKAEREVTERASTEHVDMRDILEGFYRKRGQVPVAELPPIENRENTMDRIMACFSQGLAAGRHYEPHVVAQVREWEAKKAGVA